MQPADLRLTGIHPMGPILFLLNANSPMVAASGRYLPVCLRVEHVLDRLGGLVFDPVYPGHSGETQGWARRATADDPLPTIEQVNAQLDIYSPPVYIYHRRYVTNGYLLVECESLRIGPMARYLISLAPGVGDVIRMFSSFPEGAEQLIAGLDLPTGRAMLSRPPSHFAAVQLDPAADPAEVEEAICARLDV